MKNTDKQTIWHKICKTFILPGPKELGKADSNALPMRDFGAKPGDYCWEDFYVDLKKEYPIKYFWLKTVPEMLKRSVWFRVKRIVTEPYWYLVYHLHPKHRYHMLDLRNPEYDYGWVDRCTSIVYANFKMMEDFVENELGGPEKILWITDEMIKEEADCMGHHLQRQKDHQEKLLSIYNYWKTERPARIKAHDEALMDPNKKDYKLSWQLDEENTKRETEMLHLLIEIRGCLWT